jgi:hypothetical protein
MHTLKQAAPISGLSEATLQRAIRAGKLSATRAEKDCYSYRIDPVELDRFMATRVCLVCGKPLTGAYERNLHPECRVARAKAQQDERLLDPEYHKQFYAKRRVLKSKPQAKVKARIAERKLRSDPVKRGKKNAKRCDWYHAPANQGKMEAKNLRWKLERRVRRRATGKVIARASGVASINAMEFLMYALARGPRSVVEVEREAKAQGISKRTLDRARKKLGVKTEKSGYQGASVLRI